MSTTTGKPLTAAQAAQQNNRDVQGKYAEQAHGAPGDAAALTADGPTRAYADAPEVFTKKYDSSEEKVAAFKEELDAAVADLANDENWQSYLNCMQRFHRYSPTNQLLIHLQSGGRATRVAGFKKWKEMERSVNKGEKAIGIFAPKMANIAVKDKNGNPVTGADGKPLKERRPIGFLVVPVFDVAQTDGKPLPEVERELREDPPEGFVEDMQAAAQAAGYSVEYRNMDSHARGTAQGWTDPKSKVIVVDADQTPGSQARTLAHELGHVYAGHCERLDEYHTGEGGCRGRFEVEADSVGYTVLRANGVKESDSAKVAAMYVAGWSRHDKDALRESADTVSKAVKQILTSTRFRNVEYDD